MVFVKILARLGHVFVPFPGLGNHHHDGMRERPAGQCQEFKTVIKILRVAAIFANDRQQFFQVISKNITGDNHLAGVHPVLIATQGIDLTIVAHIAERLRTWPTRKCVGAEAGVHHRHGSFHIRVCKILEVMDQLTGSEHAFVNNGAGRQTAKIIVCFLF